MAQQGKFKRNLKPKFKSISTLQATSYAALGEVRFTSYDEEARYLISRARQQDSYLPTLEEIEDEKELIRLENMQREIDEAEDVTTPPSAYSPRIYKLNYAR